MNAARPVEHEEAMSLFDIWFVVVRGKWLVIAATAVCVTVALIYVLVADPWYRAEVVLKIADTRQGQGLLGQLGGGLGGLASLAGIDVGDNKSAEPLGVLRSREFAGAFIEEQNLLPVFFADKWDAAAKRWKSSGRDGPLDVRDGIKYFQKTVLKIEEDRKSGLITVSVDWTDAKTAAVWANLLVDRVNERMRRRALVEGETTMNYLKQELASSSVVTLQQSIGRVIETELQKLILAQGSKEYAFRIIDHAQVPKWHDHPHRAVIVTAAFFLGIILAVVILLLRHVLHRMRAADPGIAGSH